MAGADLSPSGFDSAVIEAAAHPKLCAWLRSMPHLASREVVGADATSGDVVAAITLVAAAFASVLNCNAHLVAALDHLEPRASTEGARAIVRSVRDALAFDPRQAG